MTLGRKNRQEQSFHLPGTSLWRPGPAPKKGNAMHGSGLTRGVAFFGLAFLGGLAGSWLFRPELPMAGPVVTDGKPGVVATFGVGGVMTWEGELWQYRPDKESWVHLDESFGLESQATSIVPLPVKAEDIRHMETFGFLVTRDDTCWLYDFDGQRWKEIGKPPFHHRR